MASMKIRWLDAACPTCGQMRRVVNPQSLKEVREEAGVSQREFAKSLGFSAPYISDIENGNRSCSARVLEAYQELEGD